MIVQFIHLRLCTTIRGRMVVMNLAEPQAVCLQARFLPEGVAQDTREPHGNEQVDSS